ncbi:DoxX family membrane protein [Winogradskyella sp. UBA3174]|uniref:DoxX family membrane protein n=1 Tax=Winogradskyella sp. UBA3174 TaxID=1947785 RepID=UPI0025CC2949|nr:DoxX family membrane protein [Winogradskyella sp. UBA3174]|tara:strand:- start:29127 stop:29513 length:387 start_codon:yes stop_codon:yes gene_type:complete
MKSNKIILVLRIAVAVILIQTLRFKFTGHEDSVYIFETIGLEPFGRIGLGILELMAGILLLIPKTIWIGAGLALGLMSGAIMMHLTQLGIEVRGDDGVLFYTAIATFILSAIIIYSQRKHIPLMNIKD